MKLEFCVVSFKFCFCYPLLLIMNNIAAHCYEKVRVETELMQEKIQKELGLNPVDQEVIVLYDGEKAEQVRAAQPA